jgi:hypothetical protein
MTVFFCILLCVAIVVTAAVGGMVFDFNKSDAAGRGLTRAFAMFASVFLWLVIGGLVLLCGVRGGFPGLSGAVAPILYLGAAVGHFAALNILEHLESGDRYESLLRLVTIAGPYLVIICSLWNFFPGLRSLTPAGFVNGGVALAIAFLAATPWVVMGPSKATTTARDQARLKTFQDKRAREEALIATINNLPPDTPLATFVPYTVVPLGEGSDSRQAALKRMRLLPHRQRDAEELLDKLDPRVFPIVGDIGLEMTPALCQGSRRCLGKIVEQCKPPTPAPPFDSVEMRLNTFTISMQWLVDNGCDCKEEVAAFAQMVLLYPDSSPRHWMTNYLVELQKLPTK